MNRNSGTESAKPHTYRVNDLCFASMMPLTSVMNRSLGDWGWKGESE